MDSAESAGGAVKTTVAVYDELRVTVYDLDDGDTIPMHVHGAPSAHITLCSAGHCRASGPWGVLELVPGPIYDFPADSPHEFVALCDGTRIVNIQKRYQRES